MIGTHRLTPNRPSPRQRVCLDSRFSLVCAFLVGAGALAACGDDGTGNGGPDAGLDAGELPTPLTYEFESRFAEGTSSVSYSGQVMRHMLILEMKAYLGGLTTSIDDLTFVPEPGDVTAALDFYYRFDSSTSGQTALTLNTDPAPMQAVFDDISTNKDLAGKIAGSDPVGQHKDWSTEFVGWNPEQATNPEALVQYWFGRIDEQAVARAQGTIPTDPDGQAIALVYVTADGLDLRELCQKFLLGAVAMSQGMDDYLDDADPDTGLNVALEQDGDKPYTLLEHHWDEAYGYFGAARDYNDYADDEIAGAGGRAGWSSGYHDSDGNGTIDLVSEYNFGHSQNAAKRDRGSAPTAPTDYSKAVFDAFLAGRAIISRADGELDPSARAELLAQRDIIMEYWEKSVSSTIVHYINEVLRDMNTFGTAEYDFLAHAKHFSEMKGFALGLQFNPRSPLGDGDFASLHQLIGDAPVLPNADPALIDAYRDNLLAARDLLATAYEFDPANIGDTNGENGW